MARGDAAARGLAPPAASFPRPPFFFHPFFLHPRFPVQFIRIPPGAAFGHRILVGPELLRPLGKMGPTSLGWLGCGNPCAASPGAAAHQGQLLIAPNDLGGQSIPQTCPSSTVAAKKKPRWQGAVTSKSHSAWRAPSEMREHFPVLGAMELGPTKRGGK